MSTQTTLIGSKQVRERLNHTSAMTLWRWLNDERLNFPKPVYINTRRYWKEADIEAFAQRLQNSPLNTAA